VDEHGVRTTLTAHFTPGHAPDHTCWSLDEEGALFSGDNILGAGTVIVPAHGGSMRLYLESLRRLHQSRQWAVVYPGHGPPIRGPLAQQAIADYIMHREQREDQIVRHLEATGGDGAAPSELVSALYRDKVLTYELRQAAAETVYSHLVFLGEKGQVSTLDGSSRGSLGARWVRSR
jgi:ribonuclease/clavin/mitogillin